MERIRRQCEEVHAYGGIAERTGVVIEWKGLKARTDACSSMVDLIREYKLFGDGLFYIPVGLWPPGQTSVALDNIKWMAVRGGELADDLPGQCLGFGGSAEGEQRFHDLETRVPLRSKGRGLLSKGC